MENKVLAVVDGREIRESDVQNLMRNLGQNAIQFSSPQGQKQLLDEIIAQELLYSDAIENNIENEEEFIKVLEQTKKTLLTQYAVNKLISSISASDEEAKEFFNNNKSMFSQPKTAVASHILVENEDTAKEILVEINNGLDFGDAARKYSKCPSKEMGGDLGEFSPGKMVPEFEQAVFSMDTGEISEPVKTQFGYHLIKIQKVNEAKESSFEEVEDKAKKQCLLDKQQKIYAITQEELKQKYPVKYLA